MGERNQMNTLDREYIGRQAKEIKQLKDENKALKKESKRLVEASEYILLHIKPLKESRDNLLNMLKEVEKVPTDDVDFEYVLSVIKEAEDIKKKEKIK